MADVPDRLTLLQQARVKQKMAEDTRRLAHSLSLHSDRELFLWQAKQLANEADQLESQAAAAAPLAGGVVHVQQQQQQQAKPGEPNDSEPEV